MDSVLSVVVAILSIMVVGAIGFWAIERLVTDHRLANLLKLLVVLVCLGAMAVMPNLQQIDAAVAAEPVAMQDLLNLQGERRKALPRVAIPVASYTRTPAGNGIIEAAHRPAPHRGFQGRRVNRACDLHRAAAANSISIAPQAPEGAFLGPFNLAFHAAPYRR
jgi:hypothetical protein